MLKCCRYVYAISGLDSLTWSVYYFTAEECVHMSKMTLRGQFMQMFEKSLWLWINYGYSMRKKRKTYGLICVCTVYFDKTGHSIFGSNVSRICVAKTHQTHMQNVSAFFSLLCVDTYSISTLLPSSHFNYNALDILMWYCVAYPYFAAIHVTQTHTNRHAPKRHKPIQLKCSLHSQHRLENVIISF